MPAPFKFCGLLLVALTWTPNAWAQSVPDRNETWGDVTLVTTIAAGASQLLMPRVYYSSPEATAGWKARWHVSVLAPAMTLTTLALLSEYELKDEFAGARPGCDDTNRALPQCQSYGMPSTHAYGSFAAFGQGTAVFLVDTFKYSDGRFHFGAFAGEVLLPLALSGVTAAGRLAGDFETGGQVAAGAGVGFASGLIMGGIYALMQEPECGYGGNLICW